MEHQEKEVTLEQMVKRETLETRAHEVPEGSRDRTEHQDKQGPLAREEKRDRQEREVCVDHQELQVHKDQGGLLEISVQLVPPARPVPRVQEAPRVTRDLLAHRAHLVSQEKRDNPEKEDQLDPSEPPACPGLLETLVQLAPLESPDQTDKLVLQGLSVHQDLPDPLERTVKMERMAFQVSQENRARPAVQDKLGPPETLESQDLQAPQENWDQRGAEERRVPTVPVEPEELLVLLEHREKVALLAPLAPLELLEQLATLVSLVLMGQPETLDHLVPLESPAPEDHWERREHRARGATRDSRETVGIPERRVQLDPLDCQDPQGPRDQEVHLDYLVLMENLVHSGLPDCRDQMVKRETRVTLDHLDKKENVVHLESLLKSQLVHILLFQI